MRPTLRNWLFLLAVLSLVAGGFFFDGYRHTDPAEKVGVGITGYNFTNEGVQEFFVNGGYGSNLPPYGGGGATSCCVSVPAQWIPDLRVTVDWTIGHFTKPWEERKGMSLADMEKCCWTQRTLSKTVPIEWYDRPGNVQVFFLPNDEIKVYSSGLDLGHPDHPSGMTYPRDPNKPKEQQP